MRKTNVRTIWQKAHNNEPIVAITAYDYFTAKYADEAGVDIVLIGDSVEMVVYGRETTHTATMEKMIYHTEAVAAAVKNAMVVGDMPFMSYHGSIQKAVENAGRFIRAGAQAVKLEGGVTVAEKVRRIVECGIPVMGHIGLTPQSIHQFGGFKVQGRTPEAAIRLVKDAQALEEAGAFAIVLETVPAPLATLITQKISIPTIGIGAGIGCDGQVQVINDILGSFSDFVPKHAKQYVKLIDIMSSAIAEYYDEVKTGKFPTDKQSFTMDESILAELKG